MEPRLSLPSICALILLILLVLSHQTATSAKPAASPHVCIIGGGIAAASTTYFLSQLPTPPRVTVFEKSHRVGGRVRSLSLPDTPPVEAGASIIASANRLMRHFADTLNLTQVSEPDGPLGLWNGTHFVFRSRPSAAFTLLALAFRYRLSLLRMQRMVGRLLRQYDTLYPEPALHIAHVRPASSVAQLFASAPDLFAWSQRSLADVVAPLFSQRFSDELVSAIVRVNYGHEVDSIHGLAGAIGLAGSGADLWAVSGGNERVVSGLFGLSAATVLLNTTVRSVKVGRSVDGKRRSYTLSLTLSADPPDNPKETPPISEYDEPLPDTSCDAVVLAAPYEYSGVSVPPELHERLDTDRKFQPCVATFVRGSVRNATFGGGSVPEDVLTTRHGDATGFISLTPASHTDRDARGVWKVFSREPLRDDVVRTLFEDGAQKVASFPWRAYPTYSVPQRFSDFDVDGSGAFVYTSAIESAGSAMEMSAMAGMNGAALVSERLGLERGRGGSEKEEL